MPTTQDSLLEAVRNCRYSRHHPDCVCGDYRRDGAPFCTDREWRWNACVNRLIDKALAETTPNTGRAETETKNTVS